MHNPPPGSLYYGAWLSLLVGAGCLVMTLIDLAWQPLAACAAMMLLGLLTMAYLAWWRERYDEWHLAELEVNEQFGIRVPRYQALSDSIGTRFIQLVRPTFRSGS